MTRKRYPSDRKTTTLRISKVRLDLIRKAAKREGKTVSVFSEMALAMGMDNLRQAAV